MADIDFGQLSEALNDKSDRDLRNVDTTAKADAVIDYQEPTSANGYTWYRKYKSGWVEQGGYQTGNKTVTLLVEMANTNYETIINVLYNNSGGTIYSELGYATKTTTSFTKSGNANNFNWVVYGMAAN